MRALRFTLPFALGICFALPAPAQLSQTFETGEDTSNWGSPPWQDGVIVSTFLDEEFGGENAGSGTSDTQSFSRSFRDNTAGIDVAQAYTISLYVQLDTFDNPSDGLFEIADGSYGTGNAANLRVATTPTPGVFAWQARDNNLGWLDLDLTMELGEPYHVVFAVDPATFTYTAIVELTGTGGNVIQSEFLSGLAFDQNVITNSQNGNLLFYIQGSSGSVEAAVDNINIDGVPEPSITALVAAALFAYLLRRRRRLPPALVPAC